MVAFRAFPGSLIKNIFTSLLISDPFEKMNMLCFMLLVYVLHVAFAQELPENRLDSKQLSIAQ